MLWLWFFLAMVRLPLYTCSCSLSSSSPRFRLLSLLCRIVWLRVFIFALYCSIANLYWPTFFSFAPPAAYSAVACQGERTTLTVGETLAWEAAGNRGRAARRQAASK